MPEFIQAWEITYHDRSVDVVYDQHVALSIWGDSPGAEMNTLTIVRHEDGTRSYFKRCLAVEVEANWKRRGKA